MKITIFKSKTIQESDYEPYKFGYGLEQEVEDDSEAQEVKELLERQIDGWVEEETQKVLKAKKLKEHHGMVHPKLDDSPF